MYAILGTCAWDVAAWVSGLWLWRHGLIMDDFLWCYLRYGSAFQVKKSFTYVSVFVLGPKGHHQTASLEVSLSLSELALPYNTI